jgi:hypothetical protein
MEMAKPIKARNDATGLTHALPVDDVPTYFPKEKRPAWRSSVDGLTRANWG